MFRFYRATEDEKRDLLAGARGAPVSSPPLLTIDGSSLEHAPQRFVRDLTYSILGHGRDRFEAARGAFLRWEPFDLGWTHVVDPDAPIEPGQLVAIEVRAACLWSINLNRITEVVDRPDRFGFLYTTTALHVEEGQERFLIDLHPETEAVTYTIEAVSRPRHPLARFAYPFTRAMQRRFAHDSHARMER